MASRQPSVLERISLRALVAGATGGLGEPEMLTHTVAGADVVPTRVGVNRK